MNANAGVSPGNGSQTGAIFGVSPLVARGENEKSCRCHHKGTKTRKEPMMAFIELDTLECVRKQDLTGNDEPRIKLDNVVRWGPGKMKKGEIDTVNKKVKFSGSVDVELEEMDGNKSKKIGPSLIVQDNVAHNKVHDFSTSGAHYKLTYAVTK